MLCIVHTYVYSSVGYTCRYDESLLHGDRFTLASYNRPIIRGEMYPCLLLNFLH